MNLALQSRIAKFGDSSTTAAISGELSSSATIVARLDGLLALQREVAGAAYDADAMRVGLLAGIVWLGWNQALDIVEHPSPAVRQRERTALAWWLRQAELAFATGLV